MLANPIWHSLNTRHAPLALSAGLAKRYPPEVAPFVAVPEASREAAEGLERLVEPGDRVGILGVIPNLPWTVAKRIEIHQYVWSRDEPSESDPEAIRLGDEHIPAMLELAALVYPAYFREQTAKLGDYVGFFDGDRLSSMAGIRMAMDGYQEISAICTHPDYRGRGLAGRLTRHLVHQVQGQGDVAFLHTESDNPAKALYEKVGFSLHQKLPFLVLEK
jgi:ribosomal protein S18 acetylase RimI-like enzyme